MSHLISEKGLKTPGKRTLSGYKSGCCFTFIPLALLIAANIPSARGELYFNPRFLADDPAAVADLSAFEKGQEAPAGTYRVDIYTQETSRCGCRTTNCISRS